MRDHCYNTICDDPTLIKVRKRLNLLFKNIGCVILAHHRPTINKLATLVARLRHYKQFSPTHMF